MSTSEPLRAITLHQPWASLIALGDKNIETRGWATRYRGPLAIHAGSAIPSYLGLGRHGTVEIGDYAVEKDSGGLLLRGRISWPYRLPLGAVVAVAQLIDVLPMRKNGTGDRIELSDGTLRRGDEVRDISNELAYGGYRVGRFGWLLDEVAPIKPALAKGRQGLWSWSRGS